MAMYTINDDGGKQIQLSHDKAGAHHTVIFGCPSNRIASVLQQQAVANQSLGGGKIAVVAAGEFERKELEDQIEKLDMLLSNVSVHRIGPNDLKFYPFLTVDRAIVVLPESQDADESDQPLGIVVRKIMESGGAFIDVQDIAEPIVVENEPKKVRGDLVKAFVFKGIFAKCVVLCALEPHRTQHYLSDFRLDKGISVAPAEESPSPLKYQTSDPCSRLPWESTGIEDSPGQTCDVNQISVSPFMFKPWMAETKGANLWLMDTIKDAGGEQIQLSHDKAGAHHTAIFGCPSNRIASVLQQQTVANQRLWGGQITVVAAGELERKELEQEYQREKLDMLLSNVRFLSIDHDDTKLFPFHTVDRAIVVLPESQDANESDQTLGILVRKIMESGGAFIDKQDIAEPIVIENEPKKVGSALVKAFVFKGSVARYVVQYALEPHYFLGLLPRESRALIVWPENQISVKAWIMAKTKGTNLWPTVSLLSKSIWRAFKGVLNLTTVHTANLLAIFTFFIMPTVGAIAPGAATAQGTFGAGKFEKSSTIGFGVVGAIGVLFTAFGVVVAVVECRRRRATDAALGAPGGEALTEAGIILQTLAVRLNISDILHYEHVRRSEKVV